MPSHRWHAAGLAGLVGLALFLSFYRLGGMDLLDPDEARYAQTTREMMQRGDWVVPYYNGEPRLKKPPLYHWENLATYRLFGVNEFAARLPSALADLALVALTVWFTRRESGWGAGLRAGAILATFPLVAVAGRMVLLDMTLSVMIAGALVVFWQGDRGRLRPMAAAVSVGVLMGLGVLVKGPVGILVPALIMLAFVVQQREWSRLRRWREMFAALAVAVALVVPWLVLAVSRVGWEGFWSVAFRETVERYAETGLEHPEPVWFYLAVFALAAFPWSAFLVAPYLAGIRRFLLPARRPADPAEARLAAFLWLWMFVTLAFFSAGRGKLPTYILPLMPAAAMLLSLEWERWGRAAPGGSTRPARFEWAAGIALLVPAFALTWLVIRIDPAHSASFLEFWKPFLLVSVTMTAGAIVLSSPRRRWAVVPLLAVCLAVFYFHIVTTATERLEQARSLHGLVVSAGLNREPVPRIIVYSDHHPSLVFYTNRRVEHAGARSELRDLLEQPGDTVVVMDDNRLANLPPKMTAHLQRIATQGRQIALRRTEGVAGPEATSAAGP